MQPEGLPKYQAPPVFILDPTSNTPDKQELDDASPQIAGDGPIKMIESDGLEKQISVELDYAESTVDLLQTF